MSLIFKAGILSRGAQFILQSNNSKKGLFVSLVTKKTRQVYEPLVQVRFYSSENKSSLDNRERIYEGMLQNKIRFVKIFSLTTSAGSLACQPYLISKALANNSTLTAGGILFTFGFFSFVTPLLLHFITKRYVISVDYNRAKDTYIATVYTLFVQKKEIEFTPEDVLLPQMSEMLTSCTIKGSPMFMDVTLFTDIDHYKKIMGFDKPMDFSVSADDIKTPKG